MRDISKSIRDFNSGRIPFLLEMKYSRMEQDAFRFFRGTSHLYYEDVARKFPVTSEHDNTRVWACADLHLENFGSYKGDNRQVYFDMNDFDDAALLPCSVEVARTLVSIHLAAGRTGFSKAQRETLANVFIDRYFSVLAEGKATMVDAATANGIVGKLLVGLKKRKRSRFLSERIVIRKKTARLKTDHIKMWEIEDKHKKELLHFFHSHPVVSSNKKLIVTDAAHRIAGTGSLGIHRYVLLAHSSEDQKKRYLLEMKESRPTAVLRCKKFTQRKWNNDAERITSIQKRMQGVSPALLQALSFQKKHFVLKELQPTDDRVELESCRGNMKNFRDLLHTLGEVTASAHLRSSGRQGSSIADELIAFASNGSTKKELLKFASHYAQQVHTDHKTFCKKLAAGYFAIQ